MARPAGGGKRAQSDSPSHLRAALRAAAAKRARPGKPQAIFARLSDRVTLAYVDGKIIAQFEDGYSVSLGPFSAAVAERAHELRTGLPLASLASRARTAQEIERLVRRLARMGLIEYPAGRSRTTDE